MVGRAREKALFLELLEQSPSSPKLINMYGIAGIGKTALLDFYRDSAVNAGAIVIHLDGERVQPTPRGLCDQIYRELKLPLYAGADEEEMLEGCLAALRDAAMAKRLVILIDAYERLDIMDSWLRDSLLKGLLLSSFLLVIAGRTSLSERWLLSPLWRQMLVRMPLQELDRNEVGLYARSNGIADSEMIQRLYTFSKGHPMMLSLATFIAQQGLPEGEGFRDDDSVPYLVEQWMREVPDEAMRALIEAAAILRHFNQDSLSRVLGFDVTGSEFHRLIKYSFVRRVDDGYTVYFLMREAVCRDLLLRAPQRYARLRESGLRLYYQRLLACQPIAASSREAIELMYYMGDALVRAFMEAFDLVPRHYSKVGHEALSELEGYVIRRREEAQEQVMLLHDPHSGTTFDFSLTPEQGCLTLVKLDFEALLDLDCEAVRVMRNEEGRIIGLAVVIPIHEGTLPYLLQAHRSKAYFGSLTAEELEKLAVPASQRAGWFIETIDAEQFSDASQQTAIGHLLHALIFSGELIIESPVPLPYFIDTHRSLGFETAPQVTHYEYDGVTPASTFVLDLRGEKLLAYIHRMMRQTGYADLLRELQEENEESHARDEGRAAAGPAGDPIMARGDITDREKEVAKLLEQGLTNMEIAAKLFISEATVKKHMKSMLVKLGAANRTQLLIKLLEGKKRAL
ncbi:LuxR C-terminal-related transcriptional regulator [Paenibacillus sp. PL2-23]|uniref:LuxR C-terminal-related transcriptional regulator n=1 Tax=Paenibacillus sp. PL2-23 TaxID=2100729 RepID=UPI0030FB1AF0